MKILTNENTTYELNEAPEFIDSLHYCVLDYGDIKNIDYYFIPLIFLEVFNSPAVDLRIGPYRIQMPLDWSIVIGDVDHWNIEVMYLKHINDRDFSAFSFNPIGSGKKSYIPDFYDIEIVNIFPDIKWYTPKLKTGHFLTVPLENGENPRCAFFIKDVTKIPDALQISHLI